MVSGNALVELHGLLTAVASFVAEHGFWVCGLQQLHHVGSVTVVHGLSCSVACEVFLDQGLNPCPLHWLTDSYLLHHQESPYFCFVYKFICIFIFFKIPHISDVIPCLSVSDSLHMIISSSMHAAANGIISLFLWRGGIPLYIGTASSLPISL